MAWLKGEASLFGINTITYSAIAIAIIYICSWYFKKLQKVQIINQMPGPKGMPVIGSIRFKSLKGPERFRGLIALAKYGKLVRKWVLHLAYAFISGAKEVEAIMSSQKNLDKGYDYEFLKPWLRTGLLTSTGAKWHSRRKLLTPAFHFKILEDFVDVFNKQSFKMVHLLRAKADGTSFEVGQFITLCTLDIICETAMGVSVNAQDSESEYLNAICTMRTILIKRMQTPWLQPEFLFKLTKYAKVHDECLNVLHGFTRSIIRQRRNSCNRSDQEQQNKEEVILGKKKRLAFLDLLIQSSENGKQLSEEDISEEVDTFMFAGHDTTTSAINWALDIFGCHLDIQAKIHAELDSIFGDDDRQVTMDDLKEMKYLENCIKETLRLFPPVAFIGRELKEEIIIGKYRLPEGMFPTVCTYTLHRDPEQFPDPEVFDPDRFLPENCKKRHPYAYIPFSAGPRNCIGQKFAMMELKIVLTNVLRNYRVESVIPLKDVEIDGVLILKHEGGNFVKMFPRNP